MNVAERFWISCWYTRSIILRKWLSGM